MHLKALLDRHPRRASSSVPEWMLGCFRRQAISFANGLTDTQTRVFWLQGRNLTIDLRLPRWPDQYTGSPQNAQPAQLLALANQEGWCADSYWQNEQLSWSGGVSFQMHNRWPEPAILQRVGNCMMEFAPSGAYVEDWRFQQNQRGPLVSLKLVEERDLSNGELRHCGGAFIITGNWAGLVLGRTNAEIGSESGEQLRDLIRKSAHEPGKLMALFNFETSIAQGSLETGFRVQHSSTYQRCGEHLCALDGFELDSDGQLIQTFSLGNKQLQRRFEIDTLEADAAFSETSSWTPQAQTWFRQETPTLGRYLTPLY